MTLLGASLPLHAAHGTTLPVPTRLAVGAVGGLVATLVTTLVMWRQSYGYAPAYVAAALLWSEPPSDVSRSSANAAHLAAGVLAGIGFETANAAYERLREPLGITTEYAIAGLTSVSELLVGALLVVVLYGVFSWVVFPRYGGNLYETRPGTVRTQWAVSAVVYGVGVVVVVAILYETLPL